MVKGNEVHFAPLRQRDRFVEGESYAVRAALCRTARAGMVDQDFTHEARSDGEKMRAILRSQRGLPHKSQVCLVHQSCTLQRWTLLACQASPSQSAQLVVHQWD